MSRVMRAALVASIFLPACAAVAQPVQPPPPPAPRIAEQVARSQSPLVGLISSDDYPQAALDALEQGAVTVELGVTPEGRVGTCRIVRSSGSVALDVATCRILSRRARFSPARDSVGRAVTGRVEQRIRWEFDSLPYESLAAISIGRTNAVGAVLYCYDHTLTRWCGDQQFDLFEMNLALSVPMPASADLVRTATFTKGDQLAPNIAGVAQDGDQMLYSGSARIKISRNGKVTKCTEIARVGGKAGALCALARDWLFKVDPDDIETRSGVWGITLASRPPAAAQGDARP